MQLPLALALSIVALSSWAQALPTRIRRDINIAHHSLANGTTVTHSITNAQLPAELAAALEGSDVNINLTTDRRRAAMPVIKRGAGAGVNNSTINLTVIGARSIPQPKRKTLRDYVADALAAEAAANANATATAAPTNTSSLPSHASAPSSSAGTHHNIHIDASSSGEGGQGGIHNSTININLHQTGNAAKAKLRKMLRRKLALGDHSVLVDISSAAANSSEDPTAVGPAGIEDSTVHVNILPGRALNKSTGHHSIVVDSSSLGAAEAAASSTETGSHSAVVDTSSSNSSDASSASSGGVKGSTINLTVISPSDPKPEPAAAPAAAAQA
ncbi:hypothetical protein JCM8202_002873 [Rhodotorula sphaerocarpa]